MVGSSRNDARMADGEPRLELILARNFVAAVLTPAFLVDSRRVVTFFNEAAGRLIGRRFEESGRLTREEWNEIGPVDEHGRMLPDDHLPLAVALRERRPACGRFRIKTDRNAVLEVDASALPLLTGSTLHGALVMFVSPSPPSDAESV
jgi:PAS domain-containing protein